MFTEFGGGTRAPFPNSGWKSSSISFPEPTCLLVSTKTRSSGIINFQRPRFQVFRLHGACVAWFKWRLEIKLMWICSTKAFNTHWKNQESRNLALKEQQYQNLKEKDAWALVTSQLIIPELRVLVLTKRHVGSGNEIESSLTEDSGWFDLSTISKTRLTLTNQYIFSAEFYNQYILCVRITAYPRAV